MEENNLKNIVEEIGKLLANLIHDSEELQDLMEKLREEGHQPVISFEAKLTLLRDSEDLLDGEGDEEIVELNYDQVFDELVTKDDMQFLDSIHIKVERQ
jgi:hypothetical protein